MEGWSGYMWTGLILGTAGVACSERWPVIWMILEINLISFLALATQRWTRKKWGILYFVVQSVGSLIIIGGGIRVDRRGFICKIITVGLLLKAGLAPLHYWAPMLISVLSKHITICFLTWQKIAPILLLSITTGKNVLIRVLLVSIYVGAGGSLGSKDLSLLLFYSGLIHIRWVLSSPLSIAFVYFIGYVIITIPVFYCNNSKDLSLLILNLAGLPPISGFFLKLNVIPSLGLGFGFLILIASGVVIYGYLRVFLFSSQNIGNPKTATLLICVLGFLY